MAKREENASFVSAPHHEQTVHDQVIGLLQDALEKEREERKEDRFIFILVSVVLLDVVLFSAMPNFGGPIALLILQLFIVIMLARRLGLREAHRLLAGFLDRLAGQMRNESRDPE